MQTASQFKMVTRMALTQIALAWLAYLALTIATARIPDGRSREQLDEECEHFLRQENTPPARWYENLVGKKMLKFA